MRLLQESPQATADTAERGVGMTGVNTPTRKPVKLVVSPGSARENTTAQKSVDAHRQAPGAVGKPAPAWDPFNRNCVSRDLFDTISDKWAMLILLSIEDGPLRNGEIKDRVQGISPKVLTQRLSVLVDDGLVTRTSHHQIPPRVDYELTELGESVIDPIKGVYEWTVSHMGEVMASRARQPKAS